MLMPKCIGKILPDVCPRQARPITWENMLISLPTHQLQPPGLLSQFFWVKSQKLRKWLSNTKAPTNAAILRLPAIEIFRRTMDPQVVVDSTASAQGLTTFQIQYSSLGQQVLLSCRPMQGQKSRNQSLNFCSPILKLENSFKNRCSFFKKKRLVQTKQDNFILQPLTFWSKVQLNQLNSTIFHQSSIIFPPKSPINFRLPTSKGVPCPLRQPTALRLAASLHQQHRAARLRQARRAGAARAAGAHDDEVVTAGKQI